VVLGFNNIKSVGGKKNALLFQKLGGKIKNSDIEFEFDT
jgi:hypothetical protein